MPLNICNPNSLHYDTELFKSATILSTFNALPDSPDLVPSVKFIHFFSAGTDHVSKHPIYTHSDIPLTTSSGIHGPMISEWVVLQILSNSHKQKKLLEWQRERKWGAHSELGQLHDLVGQRFGILGYGSIGRQGMNIFPLRLLCLQKWPKEKDHTRKRKQYAYRAIDSG